MYIERKRVVKLIFHVLHFLKCSGIKNSIPTDSEHSCSAFNTLYLFTEQTLLSKATYFQTQSSGTLNKRGIVGMNAVSLRISITDRFNLKVTSCVFCCMLIKHVYRERSITFLTSCPYHRRSLSVLKAITCRSETVRLRSLGGFLCFRRNNSLIRIAVVFAER